LTEPAASLEMQGATGSCRDEQASLRIAVAELSTIVALSRHYARGQPLVWLLPSNQTGLPAEFKHITKRRKRN
jgi:hypothetical protein